MTSTSAPPRSIVAHKPGLRWLPIVGAAMTILLQILWPLADGHGRTILTIVTVIVFASTTVMHAWIYCGAKWALSYVALTIGFAFLIEAIGTNTGYPFSQYQYTDSLGLRIAEVPLVIPIAWSMTAYLVVLISRRISAAIRPSGAPRVLVAVIGAYAMTAWDLFLDPQMVSAGYWTWASGSQDVPGVPGIPALNFLGWFLASFVLMLLLSLLPTRTVSEAVPATLWTWTWVGGVISNAFFFDRPTVALVGGLAMAVVTVPYLWLLTRTRQRRESTTDGAAEMVTS